MSVAQIYENRAHQTSILCIDDDPVIQIMLGDVVEKAGAVHRQASTAREAESLLKNEFFDLILLDRKLPDSEGLLLIETIRENSNCPIVVLTEMDGESDRMLGLGLGATEYVCKPFSPSELTTRLRYMLLNTKRQQNKDKSRPINLEKLEFDPLSRQLKVEGDVIFLPVSEARLMHCFLANEGVVLTRDYLSLQALGREWNPGDRTIDVLISRLRRRVPKHIANIITVHRSGYIITLS